MEFLMYVSAALFFLAFVLLLSIVFYRPRVSEVPLQREQKENNAESQLSYEKKWIRWIPAFEASHPDSQILFRKTALKHGVFLEGRLARTDCGILFVIHGETGFRLLMQAVEKQLREGRLPELSCSILLCGNDDEEGMAEQDLADLLRKEKRSFDLCLTDSEHIRRIGEELYSCIAVQRKGIIDLRTASGICSLQPGPASVSGLWHQAASLLPLRLRMQLIIPLFRKKGMRNLIRVMPEAAQMFCSMVSVSGSDVRLYADNSAVMESMLSDVRSSLPQAPVLLRQTAPSRPAGKETARCLCRCVSGSFENVRPLCILGEDQRAAVLEPYCRNTASLSPTGEDVSHAGSTAFYCRLLEEACRCS